MIKVYKESDYTKVLELVKKGATIEVACKKINLSRATFYNNITAQQKAELRSFKTITNKACIGHWRDSKVDIRSFGSEDI